MRYLQRSNSADLLWNSNVLINPYILGLWLGDGDSNRTCFTNEDPEVIKELELFAKKNNLYCNISTSNSNAFKITLSKHKDDRKNVLLEGLRYYNVLNNKHIPEEYIYTSRENRL